MYYIHRILYNHENKYIHIIAQKKSYKRLVEERS
jgi:hypothetical protein